MEFYDKELLYMIRQGDVSSCEKLFDKYKLLIEKFVFDVYKICPKLDVYDIRQEMNICLFNAIDNFTDSRGLFFSYIFASVNNKATNIKREYFQSHNTYLNLSIPLDDLMFSIDRKYSYILKDDAIIANPKQNYHIQEAKEVFSNVFEQLSALEKEALKLYNLNFTRKQISEKLGCSVKQIDNALNRAKNKIRKEK